MKVNKKSYKDIITYSIGYKILYGIKHLYFIFPVVILYGEDGDS